MNHVCAATQKEKKKKNNISRDKLNGPRSWGVRGEMPITFKRGGGCQNYAFSLFLLYFEKNNCIIYAKNDH